MKNSMLLLLLVVLVIGSSAYFYLKNSNRLNFGSSASQEQVDNETIAAPLSGTTLATMNGKAIVTSESLAKEKEKLFKSNPQFEKLSAYMDIDKSLLDGLVSHYVMEEYLKEKGITNSEAYKTDLNGGYQDLIRMINAKHFSQEYPVNLTENDVKEYYEKNKDTTPGFVLSKGGVDATVVTFGQEDTAQVFAAKVKTANGNLQTATQEGKIEENRITQLRLVHDQSVGVDQAIKDAVMAMNTLPATAVVKTADNSYAVIVGTKREETKYRPYEQIKFQLKEYLEKERQGEQMEEAIKKLYKKYGVVVNESAFSKPDEKKVTDLGDLAELEEEQESVEPVFGA